MGVTAACMHPAKKGEHEKGMDRARMGRGDMRWLQRRESPVPSQHQSTEETRWGWEPTGGGRVYEVRCTMYSVRVRATLCHTVWKSLCPSLTHTTNLRQSKREKNERRFLVPLIRSRRVFLLCFFYINFSALRPCSKGRKKKKRKKSARQGHCSQGGEMEGGGECAGKGDTGGSGRY